MSGYDKRQSRESLWKRGFDIREGNPAEGEPYPYVVLRDCDETCSIGDSAITICFSSEKFSRQFNLYEAGTMKIEELVNKVEELLFACEPRFPEGRPIRVFASGTWMPVVEALSSKYPAKS